MNDEKLRLKLEQRKLDLEEDKLWASAIQNSLSSVLANPAVHAIPALVILSWLKAHGYTTVDENNVETYHPYLDNPWYDLAGAALIAEPVLGAITAAEKALAGGLPLVGALKNVLTSTVPAIAAP